MLQPNSPVTVNLIKARELIADEKRWRADDDGGDDGRYCALEALGKLAGWKWTRACGPELELLASAAKEQGDFGSGDADEQVYGVNDRLGHAAVMRMFDRAIELSLAD